MFLFDLGVVNSIAAVQIPSQIRKKWPDVTVPVSAISKNPTSTTALETTSLSEPCRLQFAQASKLMTRRSLLHSTLTDQGDSCQDSVLPACRESAKQQMCIPYWSNWILGSYILSDLLSSGNKKLLHSLSAKSTEDASGSVSRQPARRMAFGQTHGHPTLSVLLATPQEQPLLW